MNKHNELEAQLLQDASYHKTKVDHFVDAEEENVAAEHEIQAENNKKPAIDSEQKQTAL